MGARAYLLCLDERFINQDKYSRLFVTVATMYEEVVFGLPFGFQRPVCFLDKADVHRGAHGLALL